MQNICLNHWFFVYLQHDKKEHHTTGRDTGAAK